MLKNALLNNFDKKIELQKLLFDKAPSRLELLNYTPKADKTFKINIYRNHSFELIENTIKAYLDYAGISVEFTYSDYDDSLTFEKIDFTSDLIILWLDLSRYKQNNLNGFLTERINYLKKTFGKQILFIGLGEDIELEKINGVYNIKFEEIERTLDDRFYDLRMAELSGTKLSSNACLKISKELGLKYLPSALLPNIKAVVVDLDNTLYQGVLGEDGISGITLTSAHKELQKTLKMLGNNGFFVCVASKNNYEDVQELFKTRQDFELKTEDITSFHVSWNEKSQSIKEIAQELNINPDSILFIDDNIGEIAAVQMHFPEIKFILAQEDAEITKNILENYPGIYKYFQSETDSIRNQDIKANKQREIALKSNSKEDYIKSLNIELTYCIDNKQQVKRIAELSNKTNQFIFNYKRYSQSQIENLMKDDNSCVISLSLKDKLSDSGIIGCVFAKKEVNFCLIEEVFISCRALGRGITENMIFYALNLVLKKFNEKNLKIELKKGERNQPAIDFADKYLKKFIKNMNCFDYNDKRTVIKVRVENNEE